MSGAWLRICRVGLPKSPEASLAPSSPQPDPPRPWPQWAPELRFFTSPGKAGWDCMTMRCCFRSSSEACRRELRGQSAEPLLLQVLDDLTRQGVLYPLRLDGSAHVLLVGHGQEAGYAVLLGRLEATPTLSVLLLKYVWRYILGIYFPFFSAGLYFLFWILFILTSYYTR